MNPERARAELDRQALPDASERRADRIERLPRGLRNVARQLEAEPWYLAASDLTQTSAPTLDALTSSDRRAVFAALQPNLADHLERMWQDGVGRPYQLGGARRAFRAPRNPAVSLPNRHLRLVHVLTAVREHEPDAPWVARWAGYLSAEFLADSLGVFLAAVIDGGGEVAVETLEILVASAQGEDDIGAMGRHVTRALLACGRPDAWAFMESLLLAAQRSEGLRQSILESADDAHPDAFRGIVRTILDRDLLRFPSAVRAVDVWFDLAWGSASGGGLVATLERVGRFLDDPAMRDGALAHGSGEDAYLGLWSIAFSDAVAAIPRASSLLADPDPTRRFAATHLLALLGVSDAVPALADALDDDDLRVAARALDGLLAAGNRPIEGAPPDTFERLERLIGRLPGTTVKLEPIIWPWTARDLPKEVVAGGLVTYLGERDPARLIPHLPPMDPNSRTQVALRLAAIPRPGPAVRAALVTLAGDPSAWVRNTVVQAVRAMRPTDEEALELEKLLARKAGDLRRAVVSMLLSRGAPALASADRLLASRSEMQRLAGLEMLRQLVERIDSTEAADLADAARERARTYRDDAGDKLGQAERTQLEAILGGDAPTVAEGTGPARRAGESSTSLIDGFGLLDLAGRTRPRVPEPRDVEFVSDACVALVRALDDLVHEHRNTPVDIETWSGTEQQSLGELVRGFPVPVGGEPPRAAALASLLRPEDVPAALERSRARLPLNGVWETWWADRPAELRDEDGLELVRAHFVPFDLPPPPWRGPNPWEPEVDRILGGGRDGVRPRYPHVIASVLTFLAVLHPARGTARFLLDATERLMALIPGDARLDGDRFGRHGPGWRDDDSPWLVALRTARAVRRMRPDLWSPDDHARLWGLERWIDEAAELRPGEPRAGAGAAGRNLAGSIVALFREGAQIELDDREPPGRKVPPLEELVAAWRGGAATEDDVIDQIAGPGAIGGHFRSLGVLSGRAGPSAGAGEPRLAALVDRIRRRVVEVEVRRGEAPTDASAPALALQYSGGLGSLVRLLGALGRDPFVRGWSYDGVSRQVVFSRLIRTTMPGSEDTPEAFAAAMRASGVTDQRLVEVGCFAPHWATHVEVTLGWDGLASGIWWMHAHTKDPSWTVASEVRDAWKAQIAERTPLESADLVDGAVDVPWFERVYAQLGPKRWKALDAAAKYASTGGGHRRAQLFADAMRGALTEDDLRARITGKRNQDAVRALGLLPLGGAADDDAREEEVLARYRAIQEFVRTSRQFGSARQASEKRAAEIGLANLARTAGYADPIRLGWAMEARGVADLADGPLTVSAGDVVVSLAIDVAGEPDLTVMRAGVPLKALPPAVRKDRAVSALRARATELRRQASRIRRSLEAAMVRGDAFSGAEMRDLDSHPLLAPLLRRLVLVGDGIAGYPVAGGRALLAPGGREQAVGPSESLRLAHPVDLLERGDWPEWQDDVFRREVVQPFKQVFRELYLPTAGELTREAGGAGTARYAGHQVNPRQALALLTSRGWVTAPAEGARRTFHDVRLSAVLTFLEPFHTPADIDGLTLERVVFLRAGTWEHVRIDEVPPRLFSETMRDLDLVVSVAHAGGVDPEASASTVEMRAQLVTETARLLDLSNVRIAGTRALVEGSLGEYSVHLGSGVVHRRPGGALFIVPVHAQNRGRLFLPFADDDPKTAEVLAKVLLLARDADIRDPALLEQIRRS